MEQNQFGDSGFKVPVLSLGTGTFAGNDFFKASGVEEATRLIDVCLKAGS
jgi:aryl-alcohol dehydrogenase-like predicted oxidoreductase